MNDVRTNKHTFGLDGDMTRHLLFRSPALATSANWTDFGLFTAVDGPTGAQGAQGAQGAVGPAIQPLGPLDSPSFTNTFITGYLSTTNTTTTILVLTGLSNGLLTTNSASTVVKSTFASTTGMVVSSTNGVLTTDTSQDLRITATPTFVTVIWSGITTTPALIASTAGKSPTQVTLAGSNGISASITGSTLTLTASQNLVAAASPTWVVITLTGIANSVLITNSAGTVAAMSFASNNGVTGTVTANSNTLTVSTPQDVRSIASPAWITITTTSNINAILITNTVGLVTSMIFASNNGMTGTIAANSNTFTLSTPQDVRITASPIFANITITSFVGAASILFSTQDTKTIEQATLSSSNGITITLSASVLAVSASQNLAVGGSPTWVTITTTSITNAIHITNSAGLVSAMTFASNNGVTGTIIANSNTFTVSTPQDMRTTASPTLAGLTLTGFANALLGTTAGGVIVSLSFAGPNGVTTTVTSSTITISTPQDVRTTSSIVFANVTITSFIGAASILFSSQDTKTISQAALSSSNGITIALSGSVLAVSATQNLAPSGSPIWVTITTTGITNAIHVTNTAGTVIAMTFASTNGMTGTIGTNTGIFTVSTPQSVQTSASPSFTGLTVSGIAAANILVSDVGGVLTAATILAFNGTRISVSGTTITASMSQDLRIIGSPTFVAMTLTGLGNALLSTNTAGILAATLLSSSNGMVMSLLANNNILLVSTPQDIQTTASPAYVGLTLSSFTVTASILASTSTKTIQQITLTSSNGVTLTLTSAVLTVNTPQSVQTSASPSFTGLTVSGITAANVLVSGTGGILTAATLVTGNGAMFSVTGTTITSTMSQDLRSTASPTYAGVTLTGFANSLLGTTAAGLIASLAFDSSNGVTASVATSTITISTPQGVRTTDVPSFAGIILPAPIGGVATIIDKAENYTAAFNFVASIVSSGGTTITASLFLSRIGNSVTGHIFSTGAVLVCSNTATISAVANTIPPRFIPAGSSTVTMVAYITGGGTVNTGGLTILTTGGISIFKGIPGTAFVAGACGPSVGTGFGLHWYTHA